MKRIIECVPNYSEGRDRGVIDQIVNAIYSVDGVKVLNVDPGKDTNRTVITFAGVPEAVAEAAFRGEKRAAELIDMRQHHGAHPRSGATDVLPLVPVAGIALEECAELARSLAGRIYGELGIPCYCYEAAAYKPERKNLAVCRAGEYESLAEKIADPARRPDFSPEAFNETVARSGATNVGAREFLIAVNFNLNTTSVALAKEIAGEVRESGRLVALDGSRSGQPLMDADRKSVRIPGTLVGCKAIGWYIAEYGVAQVSMNITDIRATPLHAAYDEVCRVAVLKGLAVTGTELIGLIPLKCLTDAGKYFLQKQDRPSGVSDEELIDVAIKSMGLNDLREFDPRRKVIEYLLDS